MLLAVFGLIFGSSEAARDRITEQPQYFVDPNGVKVVQTAKPTAGIIATTIGVIVGLFGASGQLQEALNTIWGVKPKPGSGIWALLGGHVLATALFLLFDILVIVLLFAFIFRYLPDA